MKLRKSRSELKALVARLQSKGYKKQEEKTEGRLYSVSLLGPSSRVEITSTRNSWIQVNTFPLES